MKFLSFFVPLAAVASMAFATHVDRSAKDVWVPKVTFPTKGVELVVGKSYIIIWDTSDAPSHITNTVGAAILRKGEYTTPLVLAGNFSIAQGSVEVTIPWVLSDTDYTIVLFGDSGNYSPVFSITGPSPF